MPRGEEGRRQARDSLENGPEGRASWFKCTQELNPGSCHFSPGQEMIGGSFPHSPGPPESLLELRCDFLPPLPATLCWFPFLTAVSRPLCSQTSQGDFDSISHL